MVMGNWNCHWWVSSCTHEPVPPETILVVLTAWCGTAMSKDSRQMSLSVSGGQEKQDYRPSPRQHLWSQPSTSASAQIGSYFDTCYCCMHNSTSHFKALHSESLFPLTSTFIMNNFRNYQNEPEK